MDVGADPVEVSLRVSPEQLGAAQRHYPECGTGAALGEVLSNRGSWVENGVERHARDGSYEREEEVFALCGASMLLRRRMLDDIGLLDDRLFRLPNEDVRSLLGRPIGRVADAVRPESVVRHVHCGSSGEWSDLFRFCTERNRLLMLIKNAPARLAREAHRDYLRSTAHWIRRSREARNAELRAGHGEGLPGQPSRRIF